MTRPANIGKFILLVEEEGRKEFFGGRTKGCGLRSRGFGHRVRRPDMKRFSFRCMTS